MPTWAKYALRVLLWLLSQEQIREVVMESLRAWSSKTETPIDDKIVYVIERYLRGETQALKES